MASKAEKAFAEVMQERRLKLDVAIERYGVTKAVADVICETEHFARDASEKLYRYQDGVYKRFGERFIEQRVKAILNEKNMASKWTTRRSNEIVTYIRVDAPYLDETPPLDIINLKNGLFDVKKGELLPHDPAFRSSIQLPIAYDPDIPATEWETFEGQTLPPDCKGLIFKLAAWLMLPHKHVQKAVLLLGEGGNGKSTLLNALRAFVGRSNTASVALQKLEADKFSVIRLLGKLVNICPDLPSTYLETTSTFKALTGFNDTIEGERKYIQDSIEFEPYCRLLFSANRPPRSSDDSQGFFDRWLVVPCEAQFRGTEGEKSSDEMAAFLTSPRALSGALNRALDFLLVIRKEGIAPTESTTRAFEEFRETTDPLTVWLDRNTIVSPGASIPKDELVNAYNRECERRHRASITKTAFTQSLKRLRPIIDGQRTIDGNRVRVYEGLAWKSRRDEQF